MKYRVLIQELRRLGWYLKRQGSDHEIWTNGDKIESVPRHREINELTAKSILKRAKECTK